MIRGVVRDIAFGVQSLGELDSRLSGRARGLPEPSRQVVRQGPRGRIYLDVRWDDHGLVVEIDGAHHGLGLNPTEDNLRQNSVTLAGERVLRIDVIGLRLEMHRFMDQVEAGFARRPQPDRCDRSSYAPIDHIESGVGRVRGDVTTGRVLFLVGVLVVVVGVALSIALHEIGHLVPARSSASR